MPADGVRGWELGIESCPFTLPAGTAHWTQVSESFPQLSRRPLLSHREAVFSLLQEEMLLKEKIFKRAMGRVPLPGASPGLHSFEAKES